VARYHNGAPVSGALTTTAYPGADRTDVTGPAGNGIASAAASSTVTDVRGHTTALWTYHNNPPTPTGNPADADVTSYGFSYVANGAASTVTDATTKNTWTATTTDLLGHHVTTSDPDAGRGSSVLDDAGLLVQSTDGAGNILSFYYDALKRKTAEYNAPWTGSNSTLPTSSALQAGWSYDAAPSSDGKPTLGLPTSSTRYTDNGTNAYVTATTGYDAGGRALGTKTTIPAADGNGALAGTYQTSNSYTPVTGLLDHTDLPAAGGLPAETVYNSYNVNGLLLATGGNADYVVDTQYDQLGRVLSRTVGDYPYQTVEQNLYDAATGKVTNTFVDATAGQNPANPSQLNTYSVDDSSYTYDAAGRLTSVADLQNWSVSGSYNPGAAARDLQCYTYDYAGRLTNAWADKGDQTPPATTNLSSPTTATGGLGSCADSTADNAPASASALGGPAPYWQSYSFDTTGAAGLGNGALTGNRSSVTDHDITGNTANDITSTSAYPAAGTVNNAPATVPNSQPVTTGTGPHLLGSVTRSGGATGTDSFGYDGAGNTTSRTLAGGAKQTLSWDAEGRLSTVTDSSTTPATTATYLYDAEGNQLIRRDVQGLTGTTTLYLGSTEIHLNTANGTLSGQRYYSYDSAPDIVASSSGALTYEVENNQGTGGTTVDAATGHAVARRYTKPFGETRGTPASTWPDDHTFLNKTTDASTGLVDVGARKYDPAAGRFLSVDPVFQASDPQSVGGYAYAGNDPVSHSDASGLTRGDMCHDSGGHMDAGVCVYDSSTSGTTTTTNSPSSPQYTPLTFGFSHGHLFVVDSKGYAHAIALGPEKDGEQEMFRYLNAFLVAVNGYCMFGYDDCTGMQYLYQNAQASRDLNGLGKYDKNIPGAGLTADLIKLSWVNGHLVAVSTADVYVAGTNPSTVSREVNSKLKTQADSVIIYAKSDAAANAALRSADNSNVRLIQFGSDSSSGYTTDTGAETEMLYLSALRMLSKVVPKASGGSSKPALPAPTPTPTQLPPSGHSGGSGICGGGSNTLAGGSCIPKDIWDGLWL